MPDIKEAKNPDIIGSLAAMGRAAEAARQLAIQTNTAIVIMENGHILHLDAVELLRRQRSKSAKQSKAQQV